MAGIQKNVDQLNSFLRGEMSAVETYRQALDSLKTSAYAEKLNECLQSHQERVAILTDEILRLGGEPSKSSGPWGVFAKVVEGGAAALGENAAIDALEEGEDHGNSDYKADVSKLEGDTRVVVERQVVPLQLKSHAKMSALKKQIHH